MKRKYFWGFLCILLLVIGSTGCNQAPNSPVNSTTEKGSWAKYTPYNWTHDGDPYQSIYCDIYSDAAGSEMKQELGAIADESFGRILQLFDFQDMADFRYPPGYAKIEIYLNRNHTENIAWAYWGGFIITLRTSEISGHWYDYTVYTVGHELTHVFEFLIEGREWLATEFWFKEGIAVYIGCLRSSAFQTIQTLSELEAWIAQNRDIPGQGNPITIHQDVDFPPAANRTRYYQLFELAVRYLLNSRGLGKTYAEVLQLFYELRRGVSFAVSFVDYFGITVNEYEETFFELLRIYLGGGSP